MGSSLSRPGPRPHRRRRRAAIVGLLIAAIAALALGIFPEEPLRRLAEGQLRQALGPESRIGGIHLVPGRLGAELRNVVIEAPGYSLRIARVKVRVHPATLLGRSVSLALLEADTPELTVRAQAPAAAASEPPRVSIDRLAVSDLRLVYESGESRLLVEGVDVHGSIGGGTLELVAERATLAAPRPVVLGPARARVRLSSDLELEVETSELRLGASRASARGVVGKLTEPDLDLVFEAELQPSDVRSAAEGLLAARQLAAMDAPLRVEGRVKGRLENIRSELEAHGGLLGGELHAKGLMQGSRFEATLDWRGGDLERALFVLELPPSGLTGRLGARVAANGDAARVELRADLQGDARGGGLAHGLQAKLAGSLDPRTMGLDTRYHALVDTRATGATGTLRSARLRIDGTVRGASTPDVEGRLDGRVALRSLAGDEALQVVGQLRTRGTAVGAELEASGDAVSLRASLAATGSVIDSLRLEGRADDLRRLASNAAGRVELSLSASGPVSALDAEGRLVGESLAWNGVAVGPLTVTGRSESGRGRLELALPDWRVTGEARVERGRLSGTARLEDTPLAPFSALAPRPLEGRLAASVRFEAPLQAPASGTVAADVSALELRSGELEVRAPQPFSLRFEGDTLRLTGAALEGDGVRVEASGAARVSGPLDLATRLRLDLSRAPLPPPWTAAGTLEWEARVGGTTTRPTLSGGARIAGLALSGSGVETPLLSGAAELHFDGDSVRILPTDLALAGGSLRLEGELSLAALQAAGGTNGAPASPLQLSASWTDVQLPALAATFGSAGETPLAGTLTGELRLRGAPRPDSLEGQIVLRASAVRAGELELELSEISASLRGARLVVSPFELGSGGARLRSEAEVDLARRVVTVTSRGEADLRAFQPFVAAASLAGAVRLDLSVTGPLDALSGKGRAELAGVTIRPRDVPQAITDGEGTVLLDGSRLLIPRITARLGGGSLDLEGSARIAKAGLEDVRLAATGRELSLRYPRDFKSRLSADLTVTGRTGNLVLGGEVRILRGLYDTDIRLEKELLSGLDEAAVTDAAALPPLGLDLQVQTESAIRIRNNLGELDVTGRLHVRGDISDPAPFGRFEIREGGKVFLQTREFVVERGALAYQGTLDPQIDVRARTVISQLGGDPIEITIAASGPMLAPELDLSSQPSYSEKEIASLIATGRRNVALDSTAWVAGEQAAALLAGRATRALQRGFEPLGLDEVSIQPELLARESDPSARFTFGKHLTPQLKLVYSMGLDDAEDRYVEGQYRVRLGREFTARLMRDAEGILTYGIGQRWRFGAPDRQRRAWRPQRTALANVRVEGDLGPGDARVDRRAGDKVSAWDLLEDAEALERRLRREGHMEALVSSRLEGDVATFAVRAGPRYSADVRGLASPPDLTDIVLGALYEEEALEKGRERLLKAARQRGHVWARVDTSVERSDEARRLVFTVDAGPVVESVEVAFPGARELGKGELVEAAGGPGALLTSAARAREGVASAYRARYFLEAEVGAPRVTTSEDRTRVRIEVPVDEGRRAKLAAVRFEGASAVSEQALREAAQLVPGELPATEQVMFAGRRVRETYLEHGFVNVRVRSRLEPAGSDLVAVFDVVEGEPASVGTIRITGLHRTRESLVRRQIHVRPGDPLDPRKLSVIEKRLLDLGVFSRAVVTADTSVEPAPVSIQLEEEGPLSVAYDVRFSQEERTTTLVDLEAGNLAGLGLALGGRYRIGRDLNEVRLSLHLPSLGRGGDTTASAFYKDEDFKLVREGGSFGVLDETEIQSGFQLQQTIHASGRWNVLGGFSFKNIRSKARTLDHDLSGLQASVLRESRDNPLDARRGAFLSLSVEGGGSWTLSDFEYFRVFLQGFGVRELGRGLTWAQGLRLGLARGLEEQRDQQVSVFGRSTELFRAGGPTSLRGYALDSVGPQGPVRGVSRGGEALVVINQELRYRHPWGVGAAVFYDVGNVYARVEDIGFELRHSLGAGLRYESPIGMLRLDVGFPINPRPTDRAYQWFFALGQAF